MKETAPTTPDWQALYQAAMELKRDRSLDLDVRLERLRRPGSGQRGNRLLLEPVTSRLGIRLCLVDWLEALEEARAALGRFMR